MTSHDVDEACTVGVIIEEAVSSQPAAREPGTRTLVAILALHLALLLGYAIMSPLFQAPDELAHADMSISVLELSGYPDPGERQLNRQMLRSRAASGFSKDAVDRVPGDAPERPRPTLSALAPDEPSERLNVASQHPPLYYVSGGLFVSGVASLLSLVGAPAHDQITFLLRLFNVLLALPLPLFAYHATRRFGVGRGGGHVAAACMLAIPQLHYIGAAVNNDNGVVLAFGALTYLLARVVTGDRTLRTALAIGLVAAAGSLSKVFGLASIPWIGFAYVLTAWRSGLRGQVLRAGGVAVSVASVVGGSWYLRNLLVVGQLQPLVNDRSPGPNFVPSMAEWLVGYPPRLMQSFWGNFGYLDVPIPGWLVVGATILALLAVAAAAVTGPASGVYRLVLLAPLVLIVLGNAVQHWTTIYPRAGGFVGSQGRYLFAVIPPSAVLVGLAVRREALARAGPGALFAAAVVLHWSAVQALLDGFWGLEQGLGHALGNVLAWNPLPAPASAVVLLGVPVAAVALAGVLVTEAARAGGRPRAYRRTIADSS